MKIKDAIEQMKKLNPEAYAVFACVTKADFSTATQLTEERWKKITTTDILKGEDEDDVAWAEFGLRLGESIDETTRELLGMRQLQAKVKEAIQKLSKEQITCRI